MLKDGIYAAWYKTPLGQGTGIAHVADGKIWGGDSIMSYSGTCEVDGDRFSAIVTLKRHTEGHATVFGADDITLSLRERAPTGLRAISGRQNRCPACCLRVRLFEAKNPPHRIRARRGQGSAPTAS